MDTGARVGWLWVIQMLVCTVGKSVRPWRNVRSWYQGDKGKNKREIFLVESCANSIRSLKVLFTLPFKKSLANQLGGKLLRFSQITIPGQKIMNIHFDLLFCIVSIIALSRSYDDFQTSSIECDVWTNMFLTSTKVIFIN